jgi:hypothetical protein
MLPARWPQIGERLRFIAERSLRFAPVLIGIAAVLSGLMEARFGVVAASDVLLIFNFSLLGFV